MATRRERRLQKAEKLIQRGRLEAAIDELRLVLKESPDDTRTLNRVGDLYARLDRVDEAIDLFSQAAERFSKEGFFVKAIAIYKKILRLDPTRMPVYGSLAELYRHQGLTNEARVQYQVVADYYENGEDPAALISVYGKLVELDPADPEVRLRLADHLAGAERTEEAVDEYRQAAKALLESGDGDEALEVLLRVLEVDPRNLEFVIQTVMQLQSHSSPELVKGFLEAAIERNPEAVKARDLLDSVFKAEGEKVAEAPPPAPDEVPEAEPEPEAPPVEAEVQAETEQPAEFEIELDAFEDQARAGREETTAAETTAEQLAELLLEADALAGYGLETKATQRLERVLEESPGHLGAYRRLIAIQANARRDSRVVQLATQAAAAALESGDADGWRGIVGDLRGRGFRIEGSKILPPPAAEVDAPEELFVDSAPGPAAEAVEALEVEAEAESRAEAAVETVGPSADRADLDDQEEADWLSALSEEGADQPPATGAPVAAGESDFFDLGAELQQELEGEEDDRLIATSELEGQTVEEIVQGFKKGMAEVLSPEAYDTHYSLGVAYREMGLVDEAIGEFQLAAKDPRYLVECCSLLGQCFQEKDFADLAIKWYRKGLDSPYITEDETLGLLYEMGNLHLANGDRDAARKAFTEIYGSNSNFRDVVAKLAELRDDR